MLHLKGPPKYCPYMGSKVLHFWEAVTYGKNCIKFWTTICDPNIFTVLIICATSVEDFEEMLTKFMLSTEWMFSYWWKSSQAQKEFDYICIKCDKIDSIHSSAF